MNHESTPPPDGHPGEPGDGTEAAGVEMNEDEFDQAVTDALEAIPEALAQRLSNVAVFVEEEYEPEPWEDPGTELLGLYDGIPLTERAEMPFQLPDRIVIFRGPLLRMCADREELVEEITVTVVHEVAHFFGIDDETLHALGWG
ncbi:metallopeptidase family protein [Citricoccus nitrophenolicus]|uniref:Metallopeptidase family protein n=2 Tax=Micrococcaceae TaxID=1268 RepID=A0ABV0IHU5_9MICC|nr:metallopeptidase family protein [Citricoccus sp. I39-566]WMY78960.1 metallopeptidase family protein [Citricoccus sp. I39-566]